MRRLLQSKRGADPNQIFIYIAALVVVGFVFLYGFKAVNTFLHSSQDIELAKFVKSFQAKAKSVSTDFGSIDFITISVPSNFNRVCIIDIPETEVGCTAADGMLTNEICSDWDDMRSDAQIERKNVFFIDDAGKIAYSDFIPDVEVGDTNTHFICSRDGKLRMEGEARVARLSVVN